MVSPRGPAAGRRSASRGTRGYRGCGHYATPGHRPPGSPSLTTSSQPAPGGPRRVLDLSGERTTARDLLRGVVRDGHLLPMLARQHYRAQYRSASLGLLWSVFLPLLQGAVLAVVFTRVVRIETDQPYGVFVIAGMTTWAYMNQSLSLASTSIVDTKDLAARVYFPRMLLPAIAPSANLPGFGVSMVVVGGLALVYDVTPTWRLLLLPVAMLVCSLLVVTMAEILAIGHVYFRDLRYVVTAALLILFYGTPVFYPLELAPGVLRPIIEANPFTGAVQLVRWTFLPTLEGVGRPVAITGGWIVVLMVVGVLLFRRHERIAADRM